MRLADIRSGLDLGDVAGRYMELSRRGRELVGCCPFHGERTPSLTIFPGRDGRERFHCFGCGARGDALDFLGLIEGRPPAEVARDLVRSEHRPPPRIVRALPDLVPAWRPVLPVPADADSFNPARVWNPKRRAWSRLRPVATWSYRDAAGEVLGHVVRLELGQGRKITPAVTWCEGPGGARWCLRPFPSPAPLYGLEPLRARLCAPVLVLEGEKAATAAAAFFPKLVPVTWCGGAAGVRTADLGPLEGRDLVLWPDADEAGMAAMEELAGRVRARTVRSVRVDGLPRGFDVADFESADAAIAFARGRLENHGGVRGP